VSAMDFERALDTYSKYLRTYGSSVNARDELLSFFAWTQPEGNRFARQVKIILVSADFSKEITTSVIWLNEQGLDITCVRLKPFILEHRTLIDVQQIIPLPEAAEYTVQLRRKAEEERTAIKIIYPELNEVVSLFEMKAIPDIRILGKSHYFRYITVLEWHNSTVHYEFYQAKEFISVELQLESDAVLPLADTLKTLVGVKVGDGTELEWDPSWMAGRGRLRAKYPLNTDPGTVTEAMCQLIKLTRSKVTEKLSEIQSAS